MKMKKVIPAMTLTFFAANAFAAGGSSSVGIGNPAAQRCVDLGGKLETLKEAAGEFGVCVFDQARIDEWTLFDVTNGKKTLATNAFLTHVPPARPTHAGPRVGMPNPAAVYCDQVGGNVITAEGTGGQSGYCDFSDRSRIEEWTLFSGPKDAGNQKLTQILSK